MGIGMSTIAQWAAIVTAIGAWYFYTKRSTSSPVAQKVAAARSLLDEASGNEKKKKAPKKDKKQQKATLSRELQVPKVTLESESNEDIPDSPALVEDKGSLQRLAGFKAGQTKSNKPEPKGDKKKADKPKAAPAPAPAEVKLNPVPISPSLGAISSTSSTTGADGDIDEPDSVDEGNMIDDMLEKTTGPNVMRITPAQDEFTTVTRKKGGQQSEKKEGPTPLQKKNQKKNEMKKELKKLEKEDQLRRLEAHKKDQRLAREAETAKHPKKSQAPASNSWSGSNTPLAGSNSNVAASFLDTFDSSNSANSRSVITPSSSDIESGRPSDAIPQEYLAEHLAAQRELPLENEWVEVKPRQKKKQAPTESETDSDANQNPTADTSSVAAKKGLAAATSAPQAQQKPKKIFTDQDLQIPDMPPNENSEGWDAHAW
ncbi:hypothetical protein H072_11306 [Dactylellina haptotyla CBS 200.50]|uniref:Uncharacterized protein n=1 Tax=Dactylellina haptotyla (strain CBS 200.50) TaxID=1284197 RepID=S8BJF2_DACHA|nr:hypothetical protein H072_11306 [Dactylellina haptotyla CBS 200.50]